MGVVNEGLCASVAKPFVCRVGGFIFLEQPPEVKEQSRWQFCGINIIIRFHVLKADFMCYIRGLKIQSSKVGKDHKTA